MNNNINRIGNMFICGEIGFIVGMISTVLLERWFDFIV